jgi:hypothetical protein
MEEYMDAQAQEIANALLAYEEVREMGASAGWKRMVLEMQQRAIKQRETVEDALDQLLQGPETYERRENYRHQKTIFLAYEFAARMYKDLRDQAFSAKSLDNRVE